VLGNLRQSIRRARDAGLSGEPMRGLETRCGGDGLNRTPCGVMDRKCVLRGRWNEKSSRRNYESNMAPG